MKFYLFYITIFSDKWDKYGDPRNNRNAMIGSLVDLKPKFRADQLLSEAVFDNAEDFFKSVRDSHLDCFFFSDKLRVDYDFDSRISILSVSDNLPLIGIMQVRDAETNRVFYIDKWNGSELIAVHADDWNNTLYINWVEKIVSILAYESPQRRSFKVKDNALYFKNKSIWSV